jgi:hypothetical protein
MLRRKSIWRACRMRRSHRSWRARATVCTGAIRIKHQLRWWWAGTSMNRSKIHAHTAHLRPLYKTVSIVSIRLGHHGRRQQIAGACVALLDHTEW